MTTLVTGATGNVGRYLVAELLDRGATLRALSRRTDPDLPDAVAVVTGDLASAPPSIFHDIDAIFLFPADSGVDGFVERAIAAGVSRIVVMSSLAVSERNARDAGSSTGVHHRSVEDAVTARTTDYTILRPGNFATNLLFWTFPITSGYPVRIPYPTSSQVLIHEADVARAAAIVLTEPGHEGRVYELSGPESLTKLEQLAAISGALGREVPSVAIASDEFRSDMAQYMPAGIVEMLLRYWAETVDEPEQPLAPVLGITPTPITQWALDHRSDFGA